MGCKMCIRDRPDITRGTLEGDIVPGPITFYRLQANKDLSLIHI